VVASSTRTSWTWSPPTPITSPATGTSSAATDGGEAHCARSAPVAASSANTAPPVLQPTITRSPASASA
jgi:hypothetical protein